MVVDKYLSEIAKINEINLLKKYGEWVEEKPLGIHYSPEKTEVNLFSSGVENLVFEIFEDTSQGHEKIEEYFLDKRGKNFYNTEISYDLGSKLHRIKLKKNGREMLALHPYTKTVTLNGDKGVFIDTSKVKPENWSSDRFVETEKHVDAVIYETHVQDFTFDRSSGVREELRGKYLGLVQKGTETDQNVKTGLSHLKELGVTHLQLMPINQNGSALEQEDSSYNWGYDPENFFVPEGSYSVNPEKPGKRVLEVKEMVKKLHENGIGVVKDIVLNHTYVLGRNSLEKLSEDTFFRCTNGSGCGNELASENPIVRKFMLDVVKHWQEEYHVDGFRFDLMELHDKKTMEAIKQELEAVNNSNLLYGEPWKAQGSEIESNGAKPMNRSNQINTGIGAFNDKGRDGIKGSPDGYDRGFVTGDIPENRDLIKDVLTGEIDIFKGDPGEVIAYTTCHDGNTLYEKICESASEMSFEEKKKASALSNSITLLSQSVPFIHGGSEMLRTREWEENPYQDSSYKNSFDWSKKVENLDLSDYYSEIISIRKQHPAFRIGDTEEIRQSIEFYDDNGFYKSPKDLVVYRLTYHEDSWEDIVVAFNPHHDDGKVQLPSENWEVVLNGIENSEKYTLHETDLATVNPLSAFIAKKD